MDTTLIVALSFVAGALADHFLETKIRARIAELKTSVNADIATVKSDVAKVADAIKPPST